MNTKLIIALLTTGLAAGAAVAHDVLVPVRFTILPN